MTANGRGRLLITSSIAAGGPGPFQSTYAASKAFLRSFGEALRQEVRKNGVTVTVVEPGPTDTRFFARARMEDAWVARGPKDPASEVAREGFAAMMAGKRRVVPGSWHVKAQSALGPLVPRGLRARLQGVIAKPRDRR
jgi:short-subunit dehydrogenase